MQVQVKGGHKKLIISLLLNLFLTTSYAITKSEVHKENIAPEVASGFTQNKLIKGKSSMVVTNNPWASKAAALILKRGGNATDAAIAASFVLGLTEPQSSGLGGGGYALTYDQSNHKLQVFDGREVAPYSANPKWFMDKNDKVMNFTKAIHSPQSIGVPGEVALLYKMHQTSSKLTWKELLKPAISLAYQGFPMSNRLYSELRLSEKVFANNPEISKVYFDNNHKVKPVGTTIKNFKYAKSLELIAKSPRNFYIGQIAKDIVNTINQQAKANIYSLKDLANYKVITHDALCNPYRNYTICSIPPSSSGGITVEELLGIYERNYYTHDYKDDKWIHHFLEASKLAFADRNQYIADPQFASQPIKGLLSPTYLAKRASLVNESQTLNIPVEAGIPQGIESKYAPDKSPKLVGTTSVAIVDRYGNAISLTISIEHGLGSRTFVDGFFLNNQLTDFSLNPTDENHKLIANRVESYKRPRSSIASVMVFDKNNKLYMLTGSPGGSQIICYVAKTLIQVLDMHLTPDLASASGNLCANNYATVIESNSDLAKRNTVLNKLNKLGNNFALSSELISGLTTILKSPHGYWYGAADPRREGVAIGNK